jgi:uncharacterized protein (AIM24 family)
VREKPRNNRQKHAKKTFAHHTSDARFEVIGTPFSLLSVSLSASQTLYTRRGTLVGLSGKSENTLSTLSFLEPLQRAPVGIPFLYQKVSSTSPVTALVSTKSPISSIVSVNMDGRDDWIVSQRQALLAWTGHTLKLKPQYNVKLGLAHWGNTYITGRGLLALAGSGQIYQVQVKAGESYVAHPRYVETGKHMSGYLQLTTTTQQRRSIHSLQHTTDSLPIQIIKPPLPGPRPRLRLHGPKH